MVLFCFPVNHPVCSLQRPLPRGDPSPIIPPSPPPGGLFQTEDKHPEVLAAFGLFSTNLHHSGKTFTIVVSKHVFLLTPAFPARKLLAFSPFHLTTQKSSFIGTGSPILCPLLR